MYADGSRRPYRSHYNTGRYERWQKGHSARAGWPLALAIREARRTARLTQQALADRVGVSRAVLAQWETARRRVPMRRIPALIEALPSATSWKIKSKWSAHHDDVADLVDP